MQKMRNIHCHQTGVTKKTFGMVRHMKNQEPIDPDLGEYHPSRITMTLTGMKTFIHKITGKNSVPGNS